MDIPTFPGRSDRHFDILPEELTEGAKSAIFTYSRESNGYAEADALPRAARTLGSLACFAPDTLSKRAFDAAALQQLATHLRQPNHANRYRGAAAGFLQYFTYSGDDRNTRSNAYVGTLLGDQPYIDAAADIYKNRLDQTTHDMLSGDKAIPKDDWTWLRVGANVPEIARVSRITNIESQLARAALVVDRIVHDSDDDRELLQDVLRVETFYAPLLEIYGLHAFDMMAQSNAGKIRALKSGNEDVLEHTSEILTRAKKISTEEIMRHYFGNRPEEHIFQTARDSLYDEVITFTSTSLEELTDGKQCGELHARFKSLGKYAMKLLRNPHYKLEEETQPADVFGMLAVLPDSRQLGAFFADTINHVLASPTIDLVTSASKSHPIYIQGSSEYVRSICEQLPNEIYRQYVQIKIIDDAPADHIYQVAKFTSTLSTGGETLPIEFQFQTQDDRANARLGVPSHMNHNAGNGVASIIPGSPDDLRTIFMRKHEIDSNGERVNKNSIVHGEEFARDFKRAIGSSL